MSEIIEKVANAFGSVTWQENKTVGDYRNEVARAAIKATLEHLRNNVSEDSITEEVMNCFQCAYPRDIVASFKMICSDFLTKTETEEA